MSLRQIKIKRKLFLEGSAILLLLSLGFGTAWAQSSPAAPAANPPAAQTPLIGGGGVREVEKPLNVNGQSRNLSMMMVLKTDRDDINFVDVRKNYKDEIPKTNY